MAVSDAVRGALLLAFAWALLAGARPAGVALCVLVGLVALFSAAFNASAAAVLPDVVGAEGFAAAPAANQARDLTLALIGPVVGSVLLTVDPGLPFLVDGLSYVASLVVIRRLAAAGARAARATGRYATMLADGLRALLRDSWARSGRAHQHAQPRSRRDRLGPGSGTCTSRARSTVPRWRWRRR
jgi:hypothetical protein